MDAWAIAILDQLAAAGPIPGAELRILVGQAIARPVEPDAFENALRHLEARRLIARNDNRVKRIEPDFREGELEAPIEAQLRVSEVMAHLNVKPEWSVLQKTTVGGPTGAGPWSRPDFTLAAIRQWRFDPLRHLDVFSFELKNRAGTSLVAVHEALAHTRFSHYAFLVCPRSHLDLDANGALAEECARYGVGLCQFDLSVADNGTPLVENFSFELDAVKSAADPGAVEQHLANRLSDTAKSQLIVLASS